MRKQVGIGFALSLSMALMMTGCQSSVSSSNESDSSNDTEQSSTEQTTVYGQVTAVSDSTITLALGTQKEMTMPEGQPGGSQGESTDSSQGTSTDSSQGASTDSSQGESTDSSQGESTDSSQGISSDNPQGTSTESGSAPSMLDLTGESQEITVSDSTLIEKETMFGGQGQGGAPAGGPSDAESSDAQAPADAGSGSSDTQTPPDTGNGSSDAQTPVDAGNGSSDAQAPADAGSGSSDAQAPADAGSGSSDTQTPPDTGNGSSDAQATAEATTASFSEIAVGDILEVVLEADGTTPVSITILSMGGGMDGQGQGGQDQAPGAGGNGSETGSTDLTGAYTVDGSTDNSEEKSDGETYSSTTSDENAVLVSNGGNLTLRNGTISKSGDTSDTDQSNFYGLNAVVAAVGGSTLNLSDTKITSDSEGSNAIFSTGDGSTVTVSNVIINTTGNSSRGLDATYNGTIIADTVDITTTGAHCAPIATDRGEGTVTVSNGTLSAAGDGSPCIYSTGTITVKNVSGTATGSQCAVIEGKNSITMSDCDLTGAGKNGIMLYQSTSGDAAEGTSILSATDSTLTTSSDGAMFYVTNTDAEVDLTNTELNFGSGILIQAAGNDTNNWGTVGSNGGNLTFKASNENLSGDIQCDEISTVAFELKEASTLKGAIDTENVGDVTVTLSEDSVWNVTKDSYISAITDEDTSLLNIKSNGNTIYYDSANTTNDWLNGETIELSDGGTLAPMNK